MARAPHDAVLVLDYGSQYTQLIARRVREKGVYSALLPGDAELVSGVGVGGREGRAHKQLMRRPGVGARRTGDGRRTPAACDPCSDERAM